MRVAPGHGPSGGSAGPGGACAPPPPAPPPLPPAGPPGRPPQPVHFVTNGDRSQPLVALTFDMCQAPANPSEFDQVIVAALVGAGAPATFFLGGDWMRTHVTETRLLAGGPRFELGHHSWSPPDLRGLDE